MVPAARVRMALRAPAPRTSRSSKRSVSSALAPAGRAATAEERVPFHSVKET